jgi:hypothetical protein
MENRPCFPTNGLDFFILLEFGVKWPEVDGIKVLEDVGLLKTFA